MKRWQAVLLLAALIVLGGGCSRNEAAGTAPPARTPPYTPVAAQSSSIYVASRVPQPTTLRGTGAGNPAPNFGFLDAAGKTVSLTDLRGHPVMLNFWATWCPPCREEMPLIQRVASDTTLRDRGLLFFGANLWEDAGTVRSFMKDGGYTFPVVLDTKHDVSDAYNVRAIPTTFFIDKDGVIKARRDGAFVNEMEMARELAKILS